MGAGRGHAAPAPRAVVQDRRTRGRRREHGYEAGHRRRRFLQDARMGALQARVMTGPAPSTARTAWAASNAAMTSLSAPASTTASTHPAKPAPTSRAPVHPGIDVATWTARS